MIARPRWVPPRQWKLWSLPRSALVYVLAADLVAVLMTAAAIPSARVTGRDWLWFAILGGASLLHLEAARGIERRRELAVDGSPYTNLKSLWVFAGLLLLPLPLVVALAVLSYAYCWVRVYGPFVMHRKVFSAATFALATGCAAGVLHLTGLAASPRLPSGPWSLLAVLAAAATWWLVNYALVVGAILLSSPDTPARQALGNLADQLVVAAALGLGIAIAALLVTYVWVVPVLMVTVLALHRDLLLPQFQRAARTDAKTGLAAPTFWAEVVAAELRRARLLGATVGLLLLDVDNFKRVNDLHGHLAGDQALQAVVRAVRAEVRRGDEIGRFGGDELAVVLPNTGAAGLMDAAERIRARLAQTTVVAQDARTGRSITIQGVTASVGAAVYPDTGTSMDELMLAADAALLQAKAAGRNQVRLATPPPVPDPTPHPAD